MKNIEIILCKVIHYKEREMNGKGGEKCIYIYFKIAGASDME
jgi:hypothetical protein